MPAFEGSRTFYRITARLRRRRRARDPRGTGRRHAGHRGRLHGERDQILFFQMMHVLLAAGTGDQRPDGGRHRLRNSARNTRSKRAEVHGQRGSELPRADHRPIERLSEPHRHHGRVGEGPIRVSANSPAVHSHGCACGHQQRPFGALTYSVPTSPRIVEQSINNTIFAWTTYAITRVSTNQPRTIGLDFEYKF